jgi:hypothetical protein
MTRFLVGLILASASMATAQDAKPTMAEACKTTALIAERVVDLRKEGKSRKRTEKLVTSQLSDDAQRYLPAVFLTLDWAYSLPEEALETDIKAEWERQCMAAAQ